MTILHDSVLYGSNLWPKKGFKGGTCWDKPFDDTVWFGVNAYGFEKVPVIGRIGFQRMDQYMKPRSYKQYKMIRLIMDEAIYGGVYFEDELRNHEGEFIWFKFTIHDYY
jgi:hypothetical protein